MKRWSAILLILAAGLMSGCCCSCPGDCVPVSLEGAHDFLNYYGRCYHSFPHSCPPCPYYSGVHNGFQVYSEHDVTKSGDAPKPADDNAADENAEDEGAAAELLDSGDDIPPIPEPDGE